MKIRKMHIIDTSIDLFTKHGIKEVSIERIAKEVGVTRGNIYYHFNGGKDEIVDEILMIFDKLIQRNTPSRENWLNIENNTQNILSILFFEFREDESERCRKINRIIFSDQHYIRQIGYYVIDQLYQKREERLEEYFTALIEIGKVKPFNTGLAARLLNRSLIANALEDSYCYPFKRNALPVNLKTMQDDCTLIVRQILDGNFP